MRNLEVHRHFCNRIAARYAGLAWVTMSTPDEHAGVLMVFKAYDQISYALIMHATSEMHVQDFVRTP